MRSAKAGIQSRQGQGVVGSDAVDHVYGVLAEAAFTLKDQIQSWEVLFSQVQNGYISVIYLISFHFYPAFPTSRSGQVTPSR